MGILAKTDAPGPKGANPPPTVANRLFRAYKGTSKYHMAYFQALWL
jgi:hypothetical protein